MPARARKSRTIHTMPSRTIRSIQFDNLVLAWMCYTLLLLLS